MLPSATERVWDFVKAQPALSGFTLIGGSALALRIGHRRSEDLDLAWSGPRLPREQLQAFIRLGSVSGFDLERDEDEVTVQSFADTGLNLDDYQQNFLVNGVKVSFFTPEPPLAKVLQASPGPGVRLATLPELFKAKCLVSAVRSKTRDWIDLYLLLRDHGFNLRDYVAAFQEAGVPSQSDIGLARLCSGVPQKDDEGYAHLLVNPPTLEQMTVYFVSQRDQLEVELAQQALTRKQK